jgi:hypothetical protein
MNNELGIPARTPNELQGVSFNRQIEVNANILQYVGCFGAVYSPVNFIPEDIKNKVATKDSMMSIAVVFAAAIVLSIVIAILSVVQLSSAKGEYETASAKEASLRPIEQQYNDLIETKNQVGTYLLIQNTVNTNNNRLHGVLDEIKERCPDSFKIDSISTTDAGGTINATTSDKISSVAALVIRLNLIEDIKNVTISSSITKTEDSVTKKRQYTYTISFEYMTNYEMMDTIVKDYFSDILADKEGD